MNLWSVEHFFPHFFSTDPAKKWGKKCSTGQRFICTEVTSYKIHTLIYMNRGNTRTHHTFWQSREFCRFSFIMTCAWLINLIGYAYLLFFYKFWIRNDLPSLWVAKSCRWGAAKVECYMRVRIIVVVA